MAIQRIKYDWNDQSSNCLPLGVLGVTDESGRARLWTRHEIPANKPVRLLAAIYDADQWSAHSDVEDKDHRRRRPKEIAIDAAQPAVKPPCDRDALCFSIFFNTRLVYGGRARQRQQTASTLKGGLHRGRGAVRAHNETNTLVFRGWRAEATAVE
mgnify:CR=1 FL=1